ncbi:hypothetical protein NIES4073_34050 [Kalymmatonema gypsitolerans NIES-4073]|nr:hypothetical protein NIES4073_34050 [Scytonema sp. NIES-4073]
MPQVSIMSIIGAPTKTILILAANPKSTTSLRLDQEVRDISETVRRSQHRDRFTQSSQQKDLS